MSKEYLDRWDKPLREEYRNGDQRVDLSAPTPQR